MKPESLHALIIDRHFGELSPEAAELLEHHLAANAAARAEAERIHESLNITRDAVLRHAELAHVPVKAPVVPHVVKRPAFMPWLARAAAVVVLAALTGVGGFVMGRADSRPQAVTENVSAPRRESPWAKYRMSFDPAGDGMQIVRVDMEKLETKALP